MSATPMDPDAAAGGAHEPPSPRRLVVSAGQLGPIRRNESRASVVNRLIRLLEQAHSEGAELIAFPELALTTFFPPILTRFNNKTYRRAFSFRKQSNRYKV